VQALKKQGVAHIRVPSQPKQDTRVRVTPLSRPGQLLCGSAAMPCFPSSIPDPSHVSSVTTPERKNMQKSRRHTSGRAAQQTIRHVAERKGGAATTDRAEGHEDGPQAPTAARARRDVSARHSRFRVVASAARRSGASGQRALPPVLTAWRWRRQPPRARVASSPAGRRQRAVRSGGAPLAATRVACLRPARQRLNVETEAAWTYAATDELAASCHGWTYGAVVTSLWRSQAAASHARGTSRTTRAP
jgi:hypothetical protein